MNNMLVQIEPPSLVEQEPCDVLRYQEQEIKLENEEKPLKVITDEENDPSISEVFEDDRRNDTHVCCCCGENQSTEEMVSTPEDHEEYIKWYRILGEKFYENTHPSKYSMVCRRHFDEKLKNNELVGVSKKLSSVLRRCKYCEKMRLPKYLTSVPKGSPIFVEWVNILGEDFAKNCKTNGQCFICRTHFEDKWLGHRPKFYLPVANLRKNPENGALEENYNYPLYLNHDISSVNNNKIRYYCVYCGESKIYSDLSIVTRNPDTLKKWGQILGEEFYRKAIPGKTFICRSHFDVKWNGSRPQNLLPCATEDRNISEIEINKMSEDEEKEAEEEEEDDKLSLKQAHNYCVCVFCDKWKTLDELTQVTRYMRSNQKFIKLFGQDFLRKCRAKKRAFICRIHLIVKETSTKNVEKEVEVKVKSEEPDTYENVDEDLVKCCYCKDQNIIDNMALVPRNKKGLTEWMNILGVEFYQNVMKNKHSYICRTHFNEQWNSEKTPKHVLPVKNVEEIVEEQTPFHSFDVNIKSEFEIHEVKSEDLVKKSLNNQVSYEMPTVIKEEAFSAEDKSPVLKRIKIEIKEEPLD